MYEAKRQRNHYCRTGRKPEMRGQTGSVAGFRQSAKVSARIPSENHSLCQPLSGPQYLGEGLKLIMRPGLRLFVLIP